jgi:alpha-acetolactate decarboxylase
MYIETGDLGLAAFMKMRGLELDSCIGRVFRFKCDTECELVKRELEIAYANSCCRQHDSNVIYLRSMMTTQYRMKG